MVAALCRDNPDPSRKPRESRADPARGASIGRMGTTVDWRGRTPT
jgi:hypothetical protein